MNRRQVLTALGVAPMTALVAPSRKLEFHVDGDEGNVRVNGSDWQGARTAHFSADVLLRDGWVPGVGDQIEFNCPALGATGVLNRVSLRPNDHRYLAYAHVSGRCSVAPREFRGEVGPMDARVRVNGTDRSGHFRDFKIEARA